MRVTRSNSFVFGAASALKRLAPAALAGMLLAGGALADDAQSTFVRDVLAAHNAARAEVGVAPLVWSDRLAAEAAPWAQHLIELGHMEHSAQSARPGEGENLWMGAKDYFTTATMIKMWTDEKSDFQYGRFPDVSGSKPWQAVAHYTQMVWKNTTQVGCATAIAGKQEVLVCRYNPQGNFMGEKPY